MEFVIYFLTFAIVDVVLIYSFFFTIILGIYKYEGKFWYTGTRLRIHKDGQSKQV